MARRGKDLFQALQRRHSGAPPEPERGDALRDFGVRVREFFSGLGGAGTGGKSRSKAKSQRAAKRSTAGKRGASALPEWVPIAALAVVIFAGGFVLGRWTGPAADGPELKRSSGSPTMMRPQELDDGSRWALPAAEEEKALSSRGFPAIVCGQDRDLPVALARHFREFGVSTARIRRWPRKNRPWVWVVVVYVMPGADPDAVRDSILAVPDTQLVRNFRNVLREVQDQPHQLPAG